MGLFAPVIMLDIELISLAFGVALCALLLIEWVRLFCRSHHIVDVVTDFFDQFIDERDVCRGMAVTHIYLLVGCALPVWVAMVLNKRNKNGTSGATVDLLLPHLGWIVIGIGDSFVRMFNNCL